VESLLREDAQVAALRTVPITNSDEPLLHFVPFRADE